MPHVLSAPSTWGIYQVRYYLRGQRLRETDTLSCAALAAAIEHLGPREGIVARCISQGHVPTIIAGEVPA